MTTVFAALVAFTFSVYAAYSFRPTFASEVAFPQPDTLLPLLQVVCGEGVRTVDAKGQKALGCGDGSMEEILASRHGQRKHPWMPYVLWEADGIIFGHFLSPASEDVAINCFDCESHSALWGGTLLLTKQSGTWQPVWYKVGIITRHCRRVSLKSGREILFCEETDGGMGHSIHGLYTIDFTNPKFAWHSVVLMADSYNDPMLGGVQTQFFDRVSFETGQGGLLVRVYARHGRIENRPDYESRRLPEPKISRYEVNFRPAGAAFQVTPSTAAAAKLFALK